MGLLDQLADASHERAWYRFGPDGPRPLSRLWASTDGAGGWIVDRMGSDGGPLGMLLEASEECLTALIAAWRCGATVISLPHRPRSADVASWRETITGLMGAAGATRLAAPGAMAPDLLDLGLTVWSFEEMAAGSTTTWHDRPGSFVQCTSGSTGAPRGVGLALDAVEANVEAILARNLHEEPIMCSWLPWSHDMGLMCVLGTWASLGPRWAGKGGLALLPTARFLANPSIWLRTCHEVGATLTSGPTFAYRLAARLAGRAGDLDLGAMRVALVGAEPIQPGALEDFTAATAPFGLRPEALCPAYGLAEATVAVTEVGPDERWRAVEVSARGLAADRWEAGTDGERSVSVVDCGRPLDGMEVAVRAEPGADVGRIHVRGPSLADRHLDGTPVVEADGWLATSDLGWLDGDRLFVVGRVDDVFQVAGRNVHATHVEDRLSEDGLVPPASVAVVSDGSGGYVAVLERPRRAGGDTDALGQRVRALLLDLIGVGPREIVIVGRGALPRTASGKLRRVALRRALDADILPVSQRLTYRSGP